MINSYLIWRDTLRFCSIGFFGIIFMCFAYAIKVEATLADLKDTLVAIIGALSGTLGFIVGYYYKSTLQK